MRLFLGIEIPLFLIFQILSSVVFGFLIWRNKKKLALTSEKIFDLIFLYSLFGIFIARILYILHNFDHYSQLSWSIYPYYYLPGAERVWFKQLPWAIVKFWDDGLVYSGILFGNTVCMISYFLRRKLSAKNFMIAIKAFLISAAILLVGFLLAGSYLGEITGLPFGIKYSTDPGVSRLPVQVIEIMGLAIIFLITIYLGKLKKYRVVFGVFLFLLGWLEIAIQFLIDDGREEGNQVSIIHIVYLIFVVLGIVILAFSLQQTGEREELVENVNKEVVNRRIEPGEGKSMSFSYRDFSKTGRTSKRGCLTTFINKLKRKFKKK
jgi:prolipoprotein diacylglyceryltransferase